MNALDHALALAEQGYPVFPCRDDKRPLTEHGFKNASTVGDQIRRWWTENPDALIAVPTGSATGLFVVDVDPAGAQWYTEHAGVLPCGRVHRTRRGHHLLYRMPDAEIRNSAGKIAPGVDVRAEGGYIIWWPASGLEAVGELDEITVPPAWLVDLLTSPLQPRHDAAQCDITEGGRNMRLASLAGTLRRAGVGQEAIEAALLAENDHRCKPPLPQSEVRAVAASISRYAPAQQGPKEWPKPIDPAAYHGIAGEIVRLIEPHTEADPVGLLIQFLAMAGSIIGRGPYYLVESDKHHANLFALLIGDSAKARKGTSAGRIRAIFEGIAGPDGVADPWSRACIQSGLSSGEGLIHAVRDEQGDDPGVRDKRLFVAESEFAGLLRIMLRDGNIISRVMRDAWDRGDLGVMTKTCPTRATDAHISVVGHITAEELIRYLDRTESCNGFANRFIFAAVKRSKYLPHGGSLEGTDLISFSRRLSEIIASARKIGRVGMTPEAALRWEAVYPFLSDPKPGLFGAVTARAEAQVIRLALLYALLDGSSEIHVEHLRAALAVWTYAEESAQYVFGEALGDPVADRILSALRGTPPGLTRTDISRALGGHEKGGRIQHALDLLKSQGRARSTTRETDGREAEVWTVARRDDDP